MINDEKYEILYMFIKDYAICMVGYVAMTKSLAIYNATVERRLERVNNLENKVCFSKSLDIKKGMVVKYVFNGSIQGWT